MNRRGRPVSLASLSTGLILSTALVSLVGCGDKEFADDAYGAIDLAPYFFDGSNAANPTAGLPREIAPLKGWVAGTRADFYDFGLVNFSRKRSSAGATLTEPDTAKANPMYFFYRKSDGKPLFSKPIYDQRTGTFYMRGGVDTLNPNPRGPTNGNDGMYYSLPYSARARDTLFDADRGSDDYQRPIIDKLHNDINYSGVWEIVEVLVDSGYAPDSIKHASTLLAAAAAGKVTLNPTGKVINCPVLDDRTFVTPSNLWYQLKPRPFMEVQPRIELWFRTKLGSCYLANGWETLGKTADDNGALKDPRVPENVSLYQAIGAGGSTDERLDTFDVIRYNVGQTNNVVRQVVVPIGKHYIPKVTVPTLNPAKPSTDVRYGGDDLEMVRPRHFADQPPGYSPLGWLYDITVPQDPPFAGGAYKTLDVTDPQKVTARDAGTAVWVKNIPVAGISSPCRAEGDADCGGSPFGLTCNRFPNLDIVTVDPPTGKNIADVTIDREGGPRCDVKKVGFGEYCAPGISRCDAFLPATTPPDPDLAILKTEKPAKIAAAGGDSNTFKMPDMTTPDKVTYYKNWGYYSNYEPRGYACHPSTGGYCYVRCDGGASAGNGKDVYGSGLTDAARDTKLTRTLMPMDAPTKDWKYSYDSRCGGTAMLGYTCTSTRANRQRVCLRECTTRNTDKENALICGGPFNDMQSAPAGDGKTFFGPVRLGSNTPGPTDNLVGQSCNALQGATACSWNPDFEPRGPDTVWPQP